MVLNATSVRVGKRNQSFLCSRTCIFYNIIIIVIINIAFIVVVLMLQNHQVMVTSFGCCWYSGGTPQSPHCWSSCNVWGKIDAEGGWRVIVVVM